MATKTKSANHKPTNRIADALDAPATMKPQIVTYRIIGISPLLQNNPAEFIGKTEETGITTGKKTYNDEEEARLRCYRDDDGNYVHPAEGFIKSMLRAATGKKFGKVSAPGIIKGAVFLAEQQCIILDAKGNPATKYTIDRRPVVVGKARVLRCRPQWSPWQMDLALDIDTALVSPDMIRDVLALAGRTVGVGDYRPEKTGGYGRYRCE